MQKTPKHPTAGKAAAGKTGKAGKAGKTDTRKPLTPEQRERKNKHDRERRARIRENQRKQENAETGKQAKCGGGCHGGCCGPRYSLPQLPEPAASFFESLGRRLVELARNQLRPVVVEPGVTRHTIALPDGRTATVTVVDGGKVDPLSDYSPIPWPVRRELLLARMAREISDIVDASIEALS